MTAGAQARHVPTDASTEVELDLVVADREAAADGVVVLTLRDPAGGELPAWTAGAHVDLVLGPDLVRQYSLCGDPTDRTCYRVGVLREAEGRGGSAHVHDCLVAGAPVHVRGPRNHFPLVSSPRYLFLAGGIGVTPLLPMVASADAVGADWRLVYGGRSRASMAFAGQLQERYGDRVVLAPQDEVGLLDLEGLLGRPAEDTAVYCCGPEPLLLAVEQRCAGWPAGSLHVERFSPKAQHEPVLAGSFEVELTLTGTTVVVQPGQSILEAVEATGVDVLSSCQEGTCGTCETPVLAGEVDHRDSLLTADEQAANDTMMICVSRAACPRLVLEL
ncbi:MAG TPA: PDR/VanB family oxidoreductase [Mycobacteriales bacterium]|jgi:ferredoxin-NADP reductase|nr:PDR/VanB family oxidoreductase [Mycobacteriales bacterium]